MITEFAITGWNVNGYPGSEAKFSCLDGFVVSQDLNDYLKDLNFALDVSKNVKPIQSRPGNNIKKTETSKTHVTLAILVNAI